MEAGRDEEMLLLDKNSKDIDWKDLDATKLYLNSCLFFLGLRTVLYPLSLIKTRLQAQKYLAYSGTIDCFKKVLANEGVRGLYKGFITTSFGILPSQLLYITTLEIVRASFPKDEQSTSKGLIRNFAAGAAASLFSTLITVPLDVVTQRLMIQDGKNTDFKYRGGLDAFSSILRYEGLRGLYRGYWATLVSYAPSSAIWWSVYSVTKFELYSYRNMREWDVLIHGIAGTCAGIVAAILTNPLDVAKTRVQVSNSKQTPSILGIWKDLLAREGPRSILTRGLTARLINVIPVSLLSVTAYEKVKTLSLK
jgi:solute carrier family 25 protein 44